jgi:hypothetical protein
MSLCDTSFSEPRTSYDNINYNNFRAHNVMSFKFVYGHLAYRLRH